MMSPIAIDEASVPCPLCKHGDTTGVAIVRGNDTSNVLELGRWCPNCGAFRSIVVDGPDAQWQAPKALPTSIPIDGDQDAHVGPLRLGQLLAHTLNALKTRPAARAVMMLVKHEGGSSTLAARSIGPVDTDDLLTTVLGTICALVDDGMLIGGWPAFDEQLKIFRASRKARPTHTVLS